MVQESEATKSPEKRSRLKRIRGYFESDKALSATSAVTGVLALAATGLQWFGLENLRAGFLKDVGFPLLAALAAVLVGVFFYRSKGD
jgi:hypothetical protein